MMTCYCCSSWIWDKVEFNDGDVKDDTTSIYNWFTYDDGGVIGGLQLPYNMQQVIHKHMHTHEAPFFSRSRD